jgi:hypothetical protein
MSRVITNLLLRIKSIVAIKLAYVNKWLVKV